LTDTDKQKLTVRENTQIQLKKQKNKIQQLQTQSPLTWLDQKTRWAYSTMFPSPNGHQSLQCTWLFYV